MDVIPQIVAASLATRKCLRRRAFPAARFRKWHDGERNGGAVAVMDAGRRDPFLGQRRRRGRRVDDARRCARRTQRPQQPHLHRPVEAHERADGQAERSPLPTHAMGNSAPRPIFLRCCKNSTLWHPGNGRRLEISQSGPDDQDAVREVAAWCNCCTSCAFSSSAMHWDFLMKSRSASRSVPLGALL